MVNFLRKSNLLVGSILCNVLLLLYIATSRTAGSTGGGQPLTRVLPLQWNGGHPLDAQTGSCYCNAEQYCMCTPSLAIDLVIVSGTAMNHVWLVRRRDTDQLATMGGFVQVGETVETAVRRELKEEMGISELAHPPVLMGVYSDPRRDNRRHTVSVTYAVRVPDDVRPVAADDVKQVQRIPLDDIEEYSYFADHKTIMMDFRNALYRRRRGGTTTTSAMTRDVGDFANDIARSLCWRQADGTDLDALLSHE